MAAGIANLELSGHHSLFSVYMLFRQGFGTFVHGLFSATRTPNSQNHSYAECTTPSHSQSLANFVTNVHSQGISAARTLFLQSHSQSHVAFASEFLRTAYICSIFFEIWWPKFASESSHSHSQLYRCDRGALSSYVHYSLSKFAGEWLANRSNHIFTQITRIVATKILRATRYSKNDFRFASLPAIYRSLKALRAENRKK